MSKEKHFTYSSTDKKTQIHAIRWEPDRFLRAQAQQPGMRQTAHPDRSGEPLAIVQIAHGMQEFIDRYADFARYLNEYGILVAGNDHLGHGLSVTNKERMGYFAEQGGNRAVIADMRTLHRMLREEFPQVPYFLLGHSMGSFLARQYMCMYGKQLDGVILSGTAYHPYAEAAAGAALCQAMAKARGWTHRSTFMTNMAMGSYNKRFEPARTKQDWLTRDEKIVDEYRADERTHPMFTLNAYYNMFQGLKYIERKENLAHIPKDLPVFFIAGSMDPVGNYGEGVKRVFARLKENGMSDVACQIYPNDRHEVLNELDRDQVYKDVRTWLEERI